jgi:Na+-driven multidrug efflux pump
MHDATLPLYATIACSLLNIGLAPPLIFKPLYLGVRGSALATALAQTLPVGALFAALTRWYGLKMGLRRINWRNLGMMFRPTGA